MTRGARVRYSNPEEFIRFIEERGGPPIDRNRWRPWLLDHACAHLRHRERGVCVDLRDCRSPRGVLTAVAEVARSPWSTDADVDALQRALSDILPAPLRVPLVVLEDADVRRLAQQAADRCTTTPWRRQCQ